MSNDEFTPTEWEVREQYAAGNIHAEDEFDRMIAEVERAAAAKARGEALIEAVQAHRNLHRAYASTSVCRGGIGGQAITSHCGEVCDNYEAHEKDTEAWQKLEVEAIEYSCARAAEIREGKNDE